jgi:hypothetical protein
MRFQSKSAISRSIATIKLAGQPAQNGPRDIEVVLGRRLEHSPHRRLDGPGRFAIQSLSLSRQSQQPSAPIAFVGPSADQISTLESRQDGSVNSGVAAECQPVASWILGKRPMIRITRR